MKYVGEYVAFEYEGLFFPGKIEMLKKGRATVTSMEKCGRSWKWPERPDVVDYP